MGFLMTKKYFKQETYKFRLIAQDKPGVYEIYRRKIKIYERTIGFWERAFNWGIGQTYRHVSVLGTKVQFKQCYYKRWITVVDIGRIELYEVVEGVSRIEAEKLVEELNSKQLDVLSVSREVIAYDYFKELVNDE